MQPNSISQERHNYLTSDASSSSNVNREGKSNSRAQYPKKSRGAVYRNVKGDGQVVSNGKADSGQSRTPPQAPPHPKHPNKKVSEVEHSVSLQRLADYGCPPPPDYHDEGGSVEDFILPAPVLSSTLFSVDAETHPQSAAEYAQWNIPAATYAADRRVPVIPQLPLQSIQLNKAPSYDHTHIHTHTLPASSSATSISSLPALPTSMSQSHESLHVPPYLSPEYVGDQRPADYHAQRYVPAESVVSRHHNPHYKLQFLPATVNDAEIKESVQLALDRPSSEALASTPGSRRTGHWASASRSAHTAYTLYQRFPSAPGFLYLSSVIPGSAADAAGLVAGDVVSALDGFDSAEYARQGCDPFAIANYIAESPGKQVAFKVLRMVVAETGGVPLAGPVSLVELSFTAEPRLSFSASYNKLGGAGTLGCVIVAWPPHPNTLEVLLGVSFNYALNSAYPVPSVAVPDNNSYNSTVSNGSSTPF